MFRSNKYASYLPNELCLTTNTVIIPASNVISSDTTRITNIVDIRDKMQASIQGTIIGSTTLGKSGIKCTIGDKTGTKYVYAHCKEHST